MRSAILTSAIVLFLLPLGLSAQWRPATKDDEAPERGPALGMASVSVADGDVSILRPSGDEFHAQAGMPLVAGDTILSGENSRAEVQFDEGNFLRLDSASEVRMVALGNKSYVVEVVRGLVNYSQLRGGEADVEIKTALARVRPLKPGVFTVEFRTAGQADVTVRNGAAEVATAEGKQRVKGGTIIVRGKPEDVQIRTAKADPKTDFDKWNQRRDKMLRRGSGRGPWPFYPWHPYYAGLGFGYGYWGSPYYFGYGPRVRTVAVRSRGHHSRRR